MEEKVLIERKIYGNFGKSVLTCASVAAVILFFVVWIGINRNEQYYWYSPTLLDTLFCENFFIIVGVALIPLLLGLLIYFAFAKSQLTVTDKRIYGITVFGKRVDLPLDSVSAVSLTMVFFSGVSISTSSGRITFFLIPKRNEVYEVLSQLIIERQNKSKETVIKQETPQSNADELKKYKDLFDSGVITQEEFDAKKKQLLGL